LDTALTTTKSKRNSLISPSNTALASPFDLLAREMIQEELTGRAHEMRILKELTGKTNGLLLLENRLVAGFKFDTSYIRRKVMAIGWMILLKLLPLCFIRSEARAWMFYDSAAIMGYQTWVGMWILYRLFDE